MKHLSDSDLKICGRCGIIHSGPPFNIDEVTDRLAKEMSDLIDKEILEDLIRASHGKNSIPRL